MITMGVNAMSIGNAVLLGFVQGLTEFLPVSSTGHISIINNLFNLAPLAEGHAFFEMLLRLAAIIALLVVFWGDITRMIYETLSLLNVGPMAGQQKGRYPAVRQLVMLFVASLPMLLVLPVRRHFSALITRDVFVGVMIIFTGFMLYTSDRMPTGRKSGSSMTILDALIIGFCQCAAMIPGLSRPATTITAGIATGMRREYAVKFSLLLSLPTLVGSFFANLADAVAGGVDFTNLPAYLIGMVVALISGIVSIFVLRLVSSRGNFGKFSYYCWVVGVLGIILFMIF